MADEKSFLIRGEISSLLILSFIKKKRAKYMGIKIRKPMTIHWKKFTLYEANFSSIPMAIRLGGLPMGVPIPPTDAE